MGLAFEKGQSEDIVKKRKTVSAAIAPTVTQAAVNVTPKSEEKKPTKRLSKAVLFKDGDLVRGKSKRKKKTDPAKAAAARNQASDKAKPLSESLSEIATAMPEGSGKYGRAIKAGVAGAALGSMVGESIGKSRGSKKKKE